jgi:hypothetical protein
VIYTNPVTDPTQVNVRATLEGNFMNRILTVEPWLQQLTVTPTSIVGGNIVTGRVTLWQNAINDIVVDLSTDQSGLITFPGGSTVTVLAGTNTATFAIQTHGVGAPTLVPVTASLLGVGKTEFVNLLTANLSTVTFNPPRVTGGTSSTGTVTLDGEAGTPFVVDLTLGAGTPGYSLNPVQLTFNNGERSKTFTINTAFEAVNTSRTVTATRPLQGSYPAQSRTGTLFVDAAALLAFTIDRTSMNPGETATGTVVISVPAGTGGTTVDVSSNNPIVTVNSPVIIPAGATQANFPITAANQAVNNPVDVTITATRGPTSIPRILTINATPATMQINPASVVGGQQSQGTISMVAPAGPGGLTFVLGSSNPAAAVPVSPLIIPQGSSSGSFVINTFLVAATANVTITGTSGAIVAQANLEVRAIGVATLQFFPSRTRGGNSVTMRISLDAVAPVDLVVQMTNSNPLVASIASSYTIQAGTSFRDITIVTNRVSRTLATLVTAQLGGQLGSAVLTTTR